MVTIGGTSRKIYNNLFLSAKLYCKYSSAVHNCTQVAGQNKRLNFILPFNTQFLIALTQSCYYFGCDTVLRQAAVKSFKKEISTLKSHVHQVSMERDKLQTSLNRTTEEKATVIKEGDEHVEIIMKNAERKMK